MRKVILLDLNYTLVANSNTKVKPFELQVAGELYRQWLVELVAPHHVVLITARPAKYRRQTLGRIQQLTGWQPQEAWFNDVGLPPPAAKLELMRRHVIPTHGADAPYLAIESNPQTAAMYSSQFGIRSMRADDPRCTLEQALAIAPATSGLSTPT